MHSEVGASTSPCRQIDGKRGARGFDPAHLVSCRFCWVSFIFDGRPDAAQPPMQTYGGSWDITLKYEYGERFGLPCKNAKVRNAPVPVIVVITGCS